MRILLADDHPLFREGIKPLLHKLDAQVDIIEAKDYPSAFAAAGAEGDLDLALIDLYMPGADGGGGVGRFRAAFPDVPVIVLSASEQPEDIQHLLAVGALGYITKSSPSEVILGALRLVLAGGVYLPPSLLGNRHAAEDQSDIARQRASLTLRQLEVLGELVRGKSNRQIAESLHVTEGTVKIHLATIFRLLGVANRTEAVLVAQRMGLEAPVRAADHAP
ncbi:MAG: response regulator transcription factor [Thiobacillaceae bacterium]|nr:response regulator transcription factor [Thiobacillaceae bacterium]